MTHWKPCIKPMWIHVILSILRLKEEIGYSLLHFQKLVKCQVTSKATKRRKVEKKWEGRRVQREKEQAEGDKQNVTQELAALRAPASTDTCLLEDRSTFLSSLVLMSCLGNIVCLRGLKSSSKFSSTGFVLWDIDLNRRFAKDNQMARKPVRDAIPQLQRNK